MYISKLSKGLRLFVAARTRWQIQKQRVFQTFREGTAREGGE